MQEIMFNLIRTPTFFLFINPFINHLLQHIKDPIKMNTLFLLNPLHIKSLQQWKIISKIRFRSFFHSPSYSHLKLSPNFRIRVHKILRENGIPKQIHRSHKRHFSKIHCLITFQSTSRYLCHQLCHLASSEVLVGVENPGSEQLGVANSSEVSPER
uniref:Uncharacterized protein n=1 Tax=Cucumis sativus TaxID=3659 RepID=A0A0A0KKP2_CUCSA